MNEYISLDVHKHYTFAAREGIQDGKEYTARINHGRGVFRAYLRDVPPGQLVALEATGNWYWVVDEIEAAGARPALIHPRKAKLMMGCLNKTDKLDCRGFNRLQRNGTLPTVWIPPAPLRDLRELTRTRMFLTRQRARLKNRIQANLAKHGLQLSGFSDPFGVAARRQMAANIELLPQHTRAVTLQMLGQLDGLTPLIEQQEKWIAELVPQTPALGLLRTLPGVGPILAAVIWLEIGDVARFASAEHLASYGGTTPRVAASGDKVRYGRLRPDVNRTLKWALVEAANGVCLHQRHYPGRHVTLLYRRLKGRKGHAKAIGALARHLAEAAFHVLRRQENYREPSAGRPQKAATSQA